MKIQYVFDDNYGSIPDPERYAINDTPESETEWKSLQKRFAQAFPRYTSSGEKDYEFGEWHHGMRALYVYIYNERMYSDAFIEKTINILKTNQPSYAQFECYNAERRLIGLFMVLDNKVVLDGICEKSGLINILFPPVK